jgi:RNA polymerase sigma-70 factor (ECF subfamily)
MGNGPAPLNRESAPTPDPPAELFDQLYAELRAIAARYMARERANHTLQPTALVNEAFIRLAKSRAVNTTDRAHFLRLAARTMRRILVDHAREKAAQRRGNNVTHVSLSEGVAGPASTFDVLALDLGLEKLSQLSDRQASVIELRFFIGLTVDEVASELSVSPRTVKTDTRIALAWLRRELAG